VAGHHFRDKTFWTFPFQVTADVSAAAGSLQHLTSDRIPGFAKAAVGSDKSLTADCADNANWALVNSDLPAGGTLGDTRTPGLFFPGDFTTPERIPLNLKAVDGSLRTMLES
jgi:hypothetical protein